MKRIAMAILMLVLGSQQVHAVDDITCTISKVGADGRDTQIIAEEKSIPEFNPNQKMSRFDLGDQQEMGLICESLSKDTLRCGVFIGAKGQFNKDFDTLEKRQSNGIYVASDGAIQLITKNHAVFCSSLTLLANRSVETTSPEKPKVRTLSTDELDFCKRFGKRSESIGGDRRLLCVETLQRIEKPVSTKQLDFCAQFDRDAEGFGVDTRLNCILKVSSGG